MVDNSAQGANNGQFAMVDVGGVVYNRDHIVKVEFKQNFSRIHTVLGCDEYDGEVAKDIRRFFGAPETAAAAAPVAGREPAPPGAPRRKK